MRRTNSWAVPTQTVASLLLLAVAGCGPSEEPEPSRVVVADNARVLDPEGRASLASFDPETGVLVFSTLTPQLATLEPGDILASEIAPAAPYGFLRKVSSTAPLNEGLMVESTPASLREAIVEGEFVAEMALTPADLQDSSRQPLTVDLLGFTVPFDVGFDGSVPGSKVHLKGSTGLTMGFTVSAGFKITYDFPADFDVTTKFVGVFNLDQQANLSVSAVGAGKFDEEVLVTHHPFSPVTFYFGPIPVVLVPTATVHLSAKGQSSGELSFGVNESLGIKAGVRKNYGEGFGPVFEFTPDASAQGPTLDPLKVKSYSLQVGMPVRLSLKLYGVAGPYAELRPTTGIYGGIGAKPPFRIAGGLSTHVGVSVDVFYFGYDWSKQLSANSWTIAESSGNTAPVFVSSTPKSGTKLQLNQPIYLYANFADVEDGFNCCARQWSSDKDGPLPTNAAYAFATPGLRNVTVTGTDKGGAKTSSTFALEIVNTPPVVTLKDPPASFTWYRGVQTFLYGWAVDGNEPCSSLSLVWSSNLGEAMPPGSCDDPVPVTFASNGPRTLTLEATDSQGASHGKSVAISIVDPPGNIPPQIKLQSPADGAFFRHDQSFTLKALLYDPDDASLTYSLSTESQGNVKQIASGTVPGAANDPSGVVFTRTIHAGTELYCSAGGPLNTIELRVADGAGGHLVSAQIKDVKCAIVPF